MKILITGNMGYVGPVLVDQIYKSIKNSKIIGFDSGFYAHSLTNSNVFPEVKLINQYFGDMRDFPEKILNGIDAVVHLAAVSNDPMGNAFEEPTLSINNKASIDLAQKVINAGIPKFIFASSCSMYGNAGNDARKESDSLNPLTAYSKSKVLTETYLKNTNLNNTSVTSLRFATACGMSDRLRLDLVLNDFVACAISKKEITVLSDGKPWRPLIDVKDMARAIIWALTKKDSNNSNKFLAVNIGSDQWNYQIADLAEAVASKIPGTTVNINKDAPPDKRSYRVDFSLFKKIAPNHQPIVSLEQSINELKNGLEDMNFKDNNFRSSKYMRLKLLESHISQRRLDKNLFWI